jgi:hypothetical protein
LDLHSEQGARPGEHPGRATNPVIKVHDLSQWGPPVTKDFLGIAPGPGSLRELRAIAAALRADNEFDLRRLRGPLKVATS